METPPRNPSVAPVPRSRPRVGPSDVPGLAALAGLVAFLPRVVGLPGEPYLWVVGALAAAGLGVVQWTRRDASLRAALLRPGPLAAAATLLCVVLAYVPAVRRPLAAFDHRRCAVLGPCAGPLAVGREGQLYDDGYAPYLLADAGVLEAKLLAFGEAIAAPPGPEPAWDHARLRNDAALLWAAQRLQGADAAAIVARPEGRSLLLGTLVAEGMPPFWWAGVSWPAQRLGARPDGSFRLGLVDREAARAALAGVAARPEVLRLEELIALVRIAGLHPGLLAPAAVDAVLAAWRDAQPDPGERDGLAEVLQARDTLRALALPRARDGAVGVSIALPPGFPPEAREAIEEAFRRFLGTAGLRAIAGDDLRIRVAVERRAFEHVRQADEHRATRVEPERVQVTTRNWRTGRDETRLETRSRTVTDVRRTTGRGAGTVPVLVVTIEPAGAGPAGPEAEAPVLVLPPIAPVNVRDQDLVDGESLRDLVRILAAGGPAHDGEAFTVTYATRLHLVRPWELGMVHDFPSEDGCREACAW